MATAEQVLDVINKIRHSTGRMSRGQSIRQFYSTGPLPAILAKHLFERKNFSQAEACRKLGMSATSLNNILQGFDISENMLFRIYNYFEKIVDENKEGSDLKRGDELTKHVHPEITISRFIVHILDVEARPLTISEIVERFANAGFKSPRPSIRGRLNTLTNKGRITRVGRGVYASPKILTAKNKAIDPSDNDPPKVPEQEDGIVFGISETGKIGHARTGLVSEADDIAQIEAMRKVLMEALADLLALTEGSNAFAAIHRVAERYRGCLKSEIGIVSIDQLYAQGIRLDNANERLNREIALGELPETGLLVGEALDSILAIHGPTVLSTRRGQELLALSRQYNFSKIEERKYKERAIDFGAALTTTPNLVDADVREEIEDLNAEIGEGRFPERSSDLARRTNQNLLSVIARTAMYGALGTIASQSLLSSTLGGSVTSVGSDLIDAANLFLQSNSHNLRMLAAVAGQELSWLTTFLNWLERRRYS